MEPPPSKTKKTLRVFAAASFLNDLGSDIVYPIWPLFVTQVLKAPMAALGFLDGLGDALVSISQAVSGYLSDRWRRRKIFIWVGYLCGALSRLGYAVSAVWPQLVPFRVLDRAGKVRAAPRDAMVAGLSSDATRGRNFGLLRAMDNLGAVAGIVVCIAFVNVLGYRTLFALAALPSLAAAVLILKGIRDTRPNDRSLAKGASFKDLGTNLRLYTLLNALFGLAAFSYSFLLLYARATGAQIVFVPVYYLIFTATASLLSYPMGRLSDRIGRKPVMFIAFGFWGLVCAGVLSGGRGLAGTVALFVLYGAHKAALDPVQRTLVCELSPQAFRASCLGGFQMVVGLCALPASFLAGLLWDRFGMTAPFLTSLILTAAAGALLPFVREGRANPAR
ncbi:MAG: MFS transporter [Candidatus Aminicenantes bacterium]|nr:MFS transporter [Candidatus Aminicenantes bacterium]